MEQKKLKSRLQNKHDLEANWLKNISFIPLCGEFIVYDREIDSDGNILELPPDRVEPITYERFKIGDGIHALIDLPFANEIADFGDIEDRIAELETQMEKLLYKPISISSFSLNSKVRTVEIGTVITNVELSWSINRNPVTLTLDGESIDVAMRKKEIDNLSISYDNNKDKQWKLVATGEKGETSTQTTPKINFYNGVYYGATTKPDEYNRDFILSLKKELRANYIPSFSVDSGTTAEGKYVYYCQPTRFGVCYFKDGGFDFGNHLVGIVSFKNESDYTEDYYIYESDNPGLGSLTITVKDKDT